MWFSVSGTEFNYTVKRRMGGPVLGRQRHQGKHRMSTGQCGMLQPWLCWAGAHLLCQSRVQKISPNFCKALSVWDTAGLTASSPELVLKQELHLFWRRHPPMLPGTAWPQSPNAWPLPPCWKALAFSASAGSAMRHLCMGVLLPQPRWISIVEDK